MRVSTTSTITCPRCRVPVKGDFKYCPECAFRLRPGPPAAGEAERPTRRGTLLLVLAGAALLAAGVLVGRKAHKRPIFEFRSPRPPQLKVLDIQDDVAEIPPGVAEFASSSVWEIPPEEEMADRFLETLDGEAPEPFRDALFQPTLLANPLPLTSWTRILTAVYEHSENLLLEFEEHVPVTTEKFQMMRYEVTRGQWGECLEAVQRKPMLISGVPFVRDQLWRPLPENVDYARGYWERWWLAVEKRYEARNLALPEPERVAIPPRPAWLAAGVTQLTDKQGTLLLIPPDWVRVGTDGNISWSIEDKTEDLPVTDVSWWDVKIFIVWARKSLGLTNLALPNRGEWMRAFHGGNARRPADDFDEEGDEGFNWPWGNEPDYGGCNNERWGREGEPPRLRSVRRHYSTHGGSTVEGVLNMAGNAAEWTDNYAPGYLGGKDSGQLFAMPFDQGKDGRVLASTMACGGSFSEGLDDCRAESRVSLDKRARRIDVGFRLILRKTGF